MTVIIATTTGIYSKEAWTSSWTTIMPGEMTIDTIGQWSIIGGGGYLFCPRAVGKYPVLLFQGSITGEFPDIVFEYNPSSGYAVIPIAEGELFDAKIACGCEHGGRMLISQSGKILFSNPGQYFVGLSVNYVNVGHLDEEITGLQNLNGNLYVLKQNSIWGYGGDFCGVDGYESTEFRKIISGVGSSHQVNCVADGTIYFGNAGGLYMIHGNEAVMLSGAIRRTWQANFDKNTASLTYNAPDKQMWIKLSTASTTTYIYDIESKRIFPFNAFNFTTGFSTPDTDNLFIFGNTTENYIKKFGYTAPAAGFTPVVRTAFTDFDMPFEDKIISRVFINGTGITELKIYTRNTPGSVGTSVKTVNNPGSVVVCDNDIIGREISIMLTGNGTMIVNNVAVEFSKRRMM